MILLVGCENNNLDSNSSGNTKVSKDEPSSEAINEPKGVLMGVSGDLIRGFIKDSEFLGLQQVEPDKLFFVHLAAPGFSIQLEGKNPDEMTGAMIDISYEGENYGMGRGMIAGLFGVLLNKESSLEVNKWLTKQFADSEIGVKQGKTPKESQYEIDNLVVDFFPPTSIDNLSATVLIYATDKLIPKSNNEDSVNSNTPKDSVVTNRKGVGESSETASDTENIQENTEDINATNDYGVTRLAKASGEGNIDLVKELLSQGADPNLYKDMGEPPLLWAIRSSNDDIVKILLDAGADPNFKTSEGVTPLMIAQENGANVILKYLEEYGAME